MAKTPTDAAKPADDEKTPTDAAKPAMPAAVRLLSPYGFYDDDGNYRGWSAGAKVSDAADVALLIERLAPVERLDE